MMLPVGGVCLILYFVPLGYDYYTVLGNFFFTLLIGTYLYYEVIWLLDKRGYRPNEFLIAPIVIKIIKINIYI